MTTIETLTRDVRLALRRLIRTPGFTAMARGRTGMFGIRDSSARRLSDSTVAAIGTAIHGVPPEPSFQENPPSDRDAQR